MQEGAKQLILFMWPKNLRDIENKLHNKLYGKLIKVKKRAVILLELSMLSGFSTLAHFLQNKFLALTFMVANLVVSFSQAYDHGCPPTPHPPPPTPHFY